MVANIWVAAADDDRKQVEHHIDSGNFSANSKDPNGYTPVHAAASYGHIELLRYLIAKGGDVNIQDNDGDTPLHHCEDLKAVRVLVEELKADCRIKNEEGNTPAQAMEEEGELDEIVEYLKSLEADPTGATYDSNKQQRTAVVDGFLSDLSSSDKEKIRFTLEDANKLGNETDFDDAQKKRLEEIFNSNDPESEEQLRQFVQETVHSNFQKLKKEGQSVDVENKKRKN